MEVEPMGLARLPVSAALASRLPLDYLVRNIVLTTSTTRSLRQASSPFSSLARGSAQLAGRGPCVTRLNSGVMISKELLRPVMQAASAQRADALAIRCVQFELRSNCLEIRRSARRRRRDSPPTAYATSFYLHGVYSYHRLKCTTQPRGARRDGHRVSSEDSLRPCLQETLSKS
jgi:hypothetical protein